MNQDPQGQDQAPDAQAGAPGAAPPGLPSTKDKKHGADADFDGLADKKPEELTPEELRLMADTMPGDSPGD